MRPSKASEAKKVALELTNELFAALKELNVPLDLDQQVTLMTRLRDACERIGTSSIGRTPVVRPEAPRGATG